jgi:hypothetical protein
MEQWGNWSDRHHHHCHYCTVQCSIRILSSSKEQKKSNRRRATVALQVTLGDDGGPATLFDGCLAAARSQEPGARLRDEGRARGLDAGVVAYNRY